MAVEVIISQLITAVGKKEIKTPDFATLSKVDC